MAAAEFRGSGGYGNGKCKNTESAEPSDHAGDLREDTDGMFCRDCYAKWEFEEKDFLVTLEVMVRVKAHTKSYAETLAYGVVSESLPVSTVSITDMSNREL